MEEAPMDLLHQRTAVLKLFEGTRRRLVETGTRNRLVHVNRQSSRSNALDVINERSDDIYRILVNSGRTMRFLATGRDKENESDTPSLTEDSDSDFDQDRYTDNQLETRLGSDGLQKRLLKLARDAKTAEEEQGVNILYLALGFLTWYEDDTSSVKREAPLVLLPVELIRNKRTSTYDIKVREEDIVANLPLQERLKGDFGIQLSDIDIDDDWLPSRYFDAVADVTASCSRWAIDRDGMQLGFFSFSKLLMFRDLDPENWPENALENHELTRGLLYEGFESEKPMFGAEDNLDEKLPPESLFHVVDADASQAKVIEEVRSGRNLVVQGPPGTGKSQTIANIIAAAVRDGKCVMFVAEKMAALSVVHKRLVDVGLADICLELHSKTANKKAVLGELARTLNAARAIPEMPPSPDRLHESRDQLNRIASELHNAVGHSGDSAFSALSQQVRYMGRGTPPPKLKPDGLDKIPKKDANRLAAKIEEYGAALEVAGSLTEHPFFGTQRFDLQPTDLARLRINLDEASKVASALADAIETTSDALGMKADINLASAPLFVDQLQRLANPPELDDALLAQLLVLKAKDRLQDGLRIGAEWRAARVENAAFFVDAAWSTDVTALRSLLAAGQFSFFTRWRSAYRQASRQLAILLTGTLPKSAVDRLELVDRLIRISSLREGWRSDEAWCASTVGEDWRGERTAFSTLLDSLNWCDYAFASELDPDASSTIALAHNPELIGQLINGLETTQLGADRAVKDAAGVLQFDITSMFRSHVIDTCDLRVVAQKLALMAVASDRYDEWATLKRLRGQLETANLHDLLPLMELGKLDKDEAVAEFLFARAEVIWKLALEASTEANEAPQRTMPLYSKSAILIQTVLEPHEVDLDSLARLAFRVVENEGPIHEEEVARRVAAAFGKEKAGARIIGIVQRALKHTARLQETSLQQDDNFWFTKAQSDEPPVRDRSLESGSICKAANISMLEIKQALRLTFEDNAGGSDPEIIRAAARLFGFKRVGPDLQARLETGLRNLP